MRAAWSDNESVRQQVGWADPLLNYFLTGRTELIGGFRISLEFFAQSSKEIQSGDSFQKKRIKGAGADCFQQGTVLLLVQRLFPENDCHPPLMEKWSLYGLFAH